MTDSRKDSSYRPASRVPPQDTGLKTRLSAGFFVYEQEITRRLKGSQGDPIFTSNLTNRQKYTVAPSRPDILKNNGVQDHGKELKVNEKLSKNPLLTSLGYCILLPGT